MNYWAAPGLPRPNLHPGIDTKGKREAIIINSVCQYYKLSIKDVQKVSRKYDIVLARQMIMHLLRLYTGYSLKTIGATFKKDHTTVIHGIKTLKDRLDTEPHLVNEFSIIKSAISKAIS